MAFDVSGIWGLGGVVLSSARHGNGAKLLQWSARDDGLTTI